MSFFSTFTKKRAESANPTLKISEPNSKKSRNPEVNQAYQNQQNHKTEIKQVQSITIDDSSKKKVKDLQ